MLFLLTSSTCMWALTPQLFRIADRMKARQRIQCQPVSQSISSYSRSVPLVSPLMFFETMARATRSNISAREALLMHAHLMASNTAWPQLQQDLQSRCEVAHAIQRACDSDKNTEVFPLLLSALSHGVFIPEALDYAVSISRTNMRTAQKLQAATAHARITMRVLSILPIVIVIVSSVVSSRFRSSLHIPAVLLLMFFGIAINRLGAWWVSRLIHGAISTQVHNEIVPLIEQFTVSVKAGLSIPDACARWRVVNQVGSRISQQLEMGNSLALSLQPLEELADPLAAVVTDALTTALNDGQPVRDTAAILVAEARHAQQQHIETRIRQLSTKLSLPVVFCVLPSFVLLTLVPLIVAPILNIGTSLPSPLS